MKDIQSIIRSKGECELTLQSSLYSAIKGFPFLAEFTQYSDDTVPYLDLSIKKRAMTIGSAFNIGLKILIALVYPELTIHDYVDYTEFKETSPDWVSIAFEIKDFMPDVYKTLLTTIRELRSLESITYPKAEDYLKIADSAVTLAWIKALCDSGYFPADAGVMLKTSDTHKALVAEVYALLSNSYRTFVVSELFSVSESPVRIIFDPVIKSEKADVQSHVDLIFGDTAFDITSSEKIVNQSKPDIDNLIGFYILEKESKLFETDKTYSILKVGKYYARHNLFGVFNEEIIE